MRFFLKENEGLAMNERFERGRPAWSLLALLALLVGIAAVSCGGAAEEQHVEEPVGNEPQAGSDEEQAKADLGHPSLGSEDAPVVLIEYADFQ